MRSKGACVLPSRPRPTRRSTGRIHISDFRQHRLTCERSRTLVGTRGNGQDALIAVIGQTLTNSLVTTLLGHKQPVQVVPEPEVHGGCAYRLCHPNVVPMETAEPSD